MVVKIRKPKRLRGFRVTEQNEQWILDLRESRNMGPKSIQAELVRHDEVLLTTATIGKVLHRNGLKPLKYSQSP